MDILERVGGVAIEPRVSDLAAEHRQLAHHARLRRRVVKVVERGRVHVGAWVARAQVGVDGAHTVRAHRPAIIRVPRAVERDAIWQYVHAAAVAVVVHEEHLGGGGLIPPDEEAADVGFEPPTVG